MRRLLHGGSPRDDSGIVLWHEGVWDCILGTTVVASSSIGVGRQARCG
jgi:hypothetical protein